MNALTIEDFLAWEVDQPVKYEFDGTQPVAMTGGSPLHALIGAQLIAAIGRTLKRPCRVFCRRLRATPSRP